MKLDHGFITINPKKEFNGKNELALRVIGAIQAHSILYK